MEDPKEYLKQRKAIGKAIFEEIAKKLGEDTKIQYTVRASSEYVGDNLGIGNYYEGFLYFTISNPGLFGSKVLSIKIDLFSGYNEVDITIKDKYNRAKIIKLIEEYTLKIGELFRGGKPKINYIN